MHMRVFTDYDGLSRVAFIERTLQRMQLVRTDAREPFRLKCIDDLDPEYFRREVRFWERYSRKRESGNG